MKLLVSIARNLTFAFSLVCLTIGNIFKKKKKLWLFYLKKIYFIYNLYSHTVYT
jgi:hypothetical protein